MSLQFHIRSVINVLKIGVLESKWVSLLEKSILRSNKPHIYVKLFLFLLNKSLITAACTAC